MYDFFANKRTILITSSIFAVITLYEAWAYHNKSLKQEHILRQQEIDIKRTELLKDFIPYLVSKDQEEKDIAFKVLNLNGYSKFTLQITKENSEVVGSIFVNKGWNFVALPINTSINISNIDTQHINIIRSYQNGKWYLWDEENNTSIDEKLLTLSSGYGYWVKAAKATSIDFNGTELLSNNLLEGDGSWQMKGSDKIIGIETFFSENPTIKTIWAYENGHWKAASSNLTTQKLLSDANISKIIRILPSQGYIYK